MRLTLQHTVGAELDRITGEKAGLPLTREDANAVLQKSGLQIGLGGSEEISAQIARDLGLSQLVRSIGRGIDLVTKTQSQGSVGDVAQAHGLPVSSQTLIDRTRGEHPPSLSEITSRRESAERALEIALKQAGVEGDIPKVQTAKIPEGETLEGLARPRETAWLLYQQAKASLNAGKYELAEAQLELSATHNLIFLDAARNAGDQPLEVMRAQNRIGMVVHQLGLLAKGHGDEAGHQSNEIKALRWYADVTGGENIKNYQPAAFLNSACSYAQLGDLDRGLGALKSMLEACGSDGQRADMRKIAREDAELSGLYAGNADFQRLVAA